MRNQQGIWASLFAKAGQGLASASVITAITAGVATGWIATAAAQEAPASYPSRNILLVVPYPPGGAPDVISRVIGPQITEILGKAVVIENRPGASTTIGAGSVARAAPDGYTLLAMDQAQAVAPSTIASLKFDPVKDFAPIALTSRTEFTLVINPELPIKTVKDLVDYTRDKPEAIKTGHSGVGTPPHLFALSMLQATGAKSVLVPYRGIALAVADVVAGHIQMAAPVPSTAANLVKDGKLRMLLISGDRRLPDLPDVPTLSELGITARGFEFGTWFGWSAPAGTPRPIIDKLNAAVNAAVKQPAVIERLAKINIRTLGGTPEDFGGLIAKQVADWREVLSKAGVKAE